MTHDEIFARVDPDGRAQRGGGRGHPGLALKGDLNAESIDFLDIVFRLGGSST